MDDLTSFLSKNAVHIGWGVVSLLLLIGLAKDKLLESLKRRHARKERKDVEETLGSIRLGEDLEKYIRLQEKLARLKVIGGDKIGVYELGALAQREKLSGETLALLVTQLASLPPDSQTFREVLSLLCETR